jgi:hypothetical protein
LVFVLVTTVVLLFAVFAVFAVLVFVSPLHPKARDASARPATSDRNFFVLIAPPMIESLSLYGKENCFAPGFGERFLRSRTRGAPDNRA